MMPSTKSLRASAILVVLGFGNLLAIGPAPLSPSSADRIWFCPGPGTLDYLRLFEHPSEWERTRELVSVFKFYNQHTLSPAPSIVGPNTYDALARIGAFSQLRRWGIKTALEVGSVKEQFCDPSSGGMDASARHTVAGIRAIEAAGGHVDFVAMDEPWVSGRSRACGGPALEPTADMVAAYMTGVRKDAPRTAIGLIEAYPFSSAGAIERMLDLLEARGVPPAFLHMDVDWHQLAPGVFGRDMTRLREVCASRRIPFGIIVVGYNGDADALYAVDARGIAHLTADAFKEWTAMPEHLIFQSWVTSVTGLFITPSNLPEDRPNTHTNLVSQIFRRLRGGAWDATGTAVPRVRR